MEEEPRPIHRGKKRRIPLSSGAARPPDNSSDKSESQKKQRRKRNSWLREIHFYQKTTNLLIRKLPFCRLVKEITQSVSIGEFRYTTGAMEALQEASEAFLIKLLEDGQVCAIHARRITLMNRDLQLAQRLRGDR
ncbi:Histone H3, embryonic, putative [Trichomonas vaginalis G3]|uniref:Histone H3, embryonic, putative n=1 Tax=Trichomonas vaginalis (strain ATCC PRA-98 / G3) TaxID=412133 RepID=A2D8I4_TRIV3|nr:protein heterodimerization protein [Trichomonas vaginalis G3]EAY23233.1 Histone H3, embryonic, putative [Trichomonas vaginalis G3]KAI5534118.1 protein heterodimerization protein [Trichomonas vaginalis G3]|eukprot:XP_001584219.1 Histone H3, embryonic [Trichomonas vaginalis G3]